MSIQGFKRAVGRVPGRVPFAKYRPETPKPLDPGALYHYWHPERDGVEACPTDFARELAHIHADLRICRPPMGAPCVSHPWLVWMRQPRIQHHLSPGWQLLFAWQERTEPEGKIVLRPLPLDGRIFANLYRISVMHFGSARAYFDSIVKEIAAGKARVAKADHAYRHDRIKDFFQSTKIKNIGKGNKFALHHDGTVVPGRGEQNWLADQGTRNMPGEVARDVQQRMRISASKTRRGRG